MPAKRKSSETRDPTPTPETPLTAPSGKRSPTVEEPRRMLEPDWDPTKQWQGRPALTSDLTLTVRSRPSTE